MSHSPSETHESTHAAAPAGTSQVERDDINVALLAIVGTLLAVAVVLAVLLLQTWFYGGKSTLTTLQAVPSTDPQTGLGRARLEQQDKISRYQWLNRETQQVAIPIERAMELVARELGDQAGPARNRKANDGREPTGGRHRPTGSPAKP